MKNLVVVRHDCLPSSASVDGTSIVAADVAQGVVYMAMAQPSLAVMCISTETPQQDEWMLDLDEYARAFNESGAPETVSINGFSYVLELEALCVALSSGVLLLVHVDRREAEEVGCIDGGILALEWSPDGEVLVLVSGRGDIIMMDQAWEVIAEVPLPGCLDVAPECSDVSISWRGDGKFFSTASRLGSDRYPQTPCFRNPLLPPDRIRPVLIHIWERSACELHSTAVACPLGLDRLPVLTWQPNGRHLYSTAVGPQLSIEPPNVTPNSSNQSRSQVLLYERNGLEHGGFSLPDTGIVQSMCWSCDSELLAVVSSAAPSTQQDSLGNTDITLQVWHRSNWHWYLKYQRVFSRAEHCGKVVLRWDDQHAGRLHSVTAGGCYEMTQFQWQQCVSPMGTSMVVDGQQLLITPLRHVVIPPPMSAAKALFPEPIVSVAVNGLGQDEAVAVLGSSGKLYLLRSVEDDLWEETLEDQITPGPSSAFLLPMLTCMDEALAGGRLVRSVCWSGEASLLVLASPNPEPGLENGSGDVLVEVSFQWPAGAEVAGVTAGMQQGRTVFAGAKVSCTATTPGGGCVVQLVTGQLLKWHHGGKLEPYPKASCFPVLCPRMWPVPAGVNPPGPTQDVPPAIGLTTGGQLYWGAALVATEVTSAQIRSGGAGGPALLYTTRKSLMYTVFFSQLSAGHVHKELLQRDQDAEGQVIRRGIPVGGHKGGQLTLMSVAMRPLAATAAARDVLVRAVEQGSSLVAVPQGGVQAVLQMPRGNLETVNPRPLVLTAVAAALQQQQFAEAWDLATASRVDLNFLVDYLWPSFLTKVEEFVSQVPSPRDLCDLLYSLQPSNIVSEGGLYGVIPQLMQQSGSDKAPAAGSSTNSNKVALICTALREAVQRLPKAGDKYLDVVVASYTKSSPPQLEEALQVIRATQDATSTAVATAAADNADRTGPPDSHTAPQASAQGAATPAERALKQLLLTVDVDEVYRTALGMYQLPLAYMVIVHAQKDPGEYMLELQGFAALQPPEFQRYKIDMHLRRYASALNNLWRSGKQHFDAAISLARQHGLMRQLLDLAAGDDAARLLVLDAYGEVLEGQAKHEDAGLAFIAAGKLEKALRAYRSAGQWRLAFIVAGRLGYSKSATQQLAVQIADELLALGQPVASATVLIHYLNDIDDGVLTLTKARAWREAVRVAYEHARDDLVDTIVAPAAAEAAAGMLQDARDSCERLVKYSSRLAEVRRQKSAMAAAVEAADEESGVFGGRHMDDDAMSDADSNMSGMSAYTDNTHTGGTVTVSGHGSSKAASTIGGRKATKKDAKKASKRGNKIRQGSANEENALIEHLLGLAPAGYLLEEAGQLCEVLVLLGHFKDALVLQRQLSAWTRLHQASNSNPVVAATPKTAAATSVADSIQWKFDILRDAT